MSRTDPHFSATLGEVAAACEGTVEDGRENLVVSGVSTDTRELAGGELFVALVGQNHDAHEFLSAAREKGAAAAVISDPEQAPTDLPVVIVEDTLRALGLLAAWHRAKMPARVLGITGSTGKTTTKDMLGQIAQRVGSAVVAEGTHNNEIGVPQTLLRLSPEDRFCVLEMAMRGPGEIDYLAGIARPDVGVITNIGQSHVGQLGSREAIAQAKAELLGHVPVDGAVVLNADDFFFSVLCAMAEAPVVSFGIEHEADFRAVDVDDGDVKGVGFRMVTPLGEADVRMPVPGRHSVMNGLAAAAAASQIGATLEEICRSLEEYAGSPMRMQRLGGKRGAVILNDAYNASPDSVGAALNVLASAEGRRVFVFGDMLEMGAEAEPAHRQIGRAAAEAGVDWLITVGELAALAAEGAAERGVRVSTVDEAPAAAELVDSELREDDVVLVKASRGMALERVVEALTDDN
ncbi:MAG: UDP-N-acetylmuramoyl-tripeptide--D-alanyl-D-alanine ligase [Armatimonadota bacterium]